MRTRITFIAAFATLASAAAFASYIPKQDIHIKREAATKFVITGKNSWGAVNVNVEDKHLFQGFRAEGKAGDKDVLIDVKSAGLTSGWKLEGKIGADTVDGTAKQDGVMSKMWTVKAKVGSRMIEVKVDNEWDIDPAASAVFVLFDCCDETPKETPKK